MDIRELEIGLVHILVHEKPTVVKEKNSIVFPIEGDENITKPHAPFAGVKIRILRVSFVARIEIEPVKKRPARGVLIPSRPIYVVRLNRPAAIERKDE